MLQSQQLLFSCSYKWISQHEQSILMFVSLLFPFTGLIQPFWTKYRIKLASTTDTTSDKLQHYQSSPLVKLIKAVSLWLQRSRSLHTIVLEMASMSFSPSLLLKRVVAMISSQQPHLKESYDLIGEKVFSPYIEELSLPKQDKHTPIWQTLSKLVLQYTRMNRRWGYYGLNSSEEGRTL